MSPQILSIKSFLFLQSPHISPHHLLPIPEVPTHFLLLFPSPNKLLPMTFTSSTYPYSTHERRRASLKRGGERQHRFSIIPRSTLFSPPLGSSSYLKVSTQSSMYRLLLGCTLCKRQFQVFRVRRCWGDSFRNFIAVNNFIGRHFISPHFLRAISLNYP